jgi:hypothetical protein
MQPAVAHPGLWALMRHSQTVLETERWGHPNRTRRDPESTSVDTHGRKPAVDLRIRLEVRANLPPRAHPRLACAASRCRSVGCRGELAEERKLTTFLGNEEASVAIPPEFRASRMPKALVSTHRRPNPGD